MAATAGAGQPTGVRELRLGLVLYGGVSLAIYMHGASKELHRLVRGSGRPGGAGPDVDRDGDGDADEPGGDVSALTPSEEVYRDLVAAKAAEEGVRTRVVVDTVAGTSAGGINGVYLAKALAHDLPQDALRDLWFDRGDMDAIVRGPKWLPWQARLPWVAATYWRKPVLDGDPMSGWLFDALAGMNRAAAPAGTPEADDGGGPTLLPPGSELELFVTLTDFRGYSRRLPVGDPPVVAERRHRHVMAFRRGRGRDDFSPRAVHDAALAFAARATSSLPGGFPPVTVPTFQGALRRRSNVTVDLAGAEGSEGFRAYELAGVDVRSAVFVDGGVLDNKPFGHALAAIQQKRAEVEVDRRLIYLEPNPVDPEGADGGDAGGSRRGTRTPSPLATALGALTGIPRHEPIIDDILDLQARNARVRRLRHVIEANWPEAAAAVEGALDEDAADALLHADDAAVAAVRDRVHEQALSRAGLGRALYVRAKVVDAVEHWAHTVCRLLRFPADSTHAAFVRETLGRWAEQAGLFGPGDAAGTEPGGPTVTQVAFLRDLDVGYRLRRLRFVLAGLGWWYQPGREPDFPVPDRAQLDAASGVVSEALDGLRAAMDGQDAPDELVDALHDCLHEDRLAGYVHGGDAGVTGFLDDHAAQLDDVVAACRAHLRRRVAGLGLRLGRDLATRAADWHPEARRRLAIRLVGFPLWDALLFPYQSVAGVGEQDHVELTRLSPRDARLLPPRGSGDKLVGARHHHLGAFFTRAGRESDYLWGRLDGAERMVTVLLGADHPDRQAWCHRAFAAILAEEADAVPEAADLVGQVRAQIDAGSRRRARG